MHTTIDLALVQSLIAQHKPELVAALRAHGVSEDALDRLVVRNSATGEILTNTAPGGELEPASDRIRALMVDDTEYTPNDIALMPPKAVLRDPSRKAHHDAKVRAMMLAVLEHNRPDLRRHPRVNAAANYFVEFVTLNRAILAMLPDNRARWTVMMNSIIEFLEGSQHVRRGAAI